MPDENLMYRMLFFEKRMVFDNDGNIINTKKDLKFEVRVPVDTIAGLMRSIFQLHEYNSTIQELSKKPTNAEIESQNKFSKKYFSTKYSSDDKSFDDVTDAKFRYIKKALGHWYGGK